LVRFYHLDPATWPRIPTRIKFSLIEWMERLDAEEKLDLAMIVQLFAQTPQGKEHAASLHAAQRRWRAPLLEKVRPAPAPVAPIERIDLGKLDEDARAALKEWAAGEGLRTN
jgi:hypothetical protein